ncbi:MAG: bacterial Ig-like domain-containing protein [Clostridiales bacterium]|nr:bacterial Ig-like domain-containing protein [Clostridiales bacterium]
MKLKRTLVAIFTVTVLVCVSLFAVACAESKTATGIEITTPPAKTDYVAGEKFDPTGMVVSLVYDNGGKNAVTGYACSPSGKLKTSDKTVTVTFKTEGGKQLTAKQSIKVHNDVKSVVIKQQPENTLYVVGEMFNPLGMVVTATYEDGSSSDVEITSDNATYKKDPLTKDDAEFSVTYKGKTVTVSLTIMNGIFVEAEDGEVVTNASSYIFDDAVGLGDKYDATGGLYVAELSAGDSITFKFASDRDGEADLSFRMASKHITEVGGEYGWTPIAVGETRLNKICDVVVNGTTLEISDDAVLPGSKSESGDPDQRLWFMWQVVTLENVDIREGENTVKLIFKTHDYYDCAEGEVANAFNGRFTANVDNMRVFTDCNVEAYRLSYSVGAAKLEVDGDKAAYIIYGTYEISGYPEDNLKAILEGRHFDLQSSAYMYNRSNGVAADDNDNVWNGNWDYNDIGAYSVIFYTSDDGVKTFEVKYDITWLGEYFYISHYGSSNKDDFKPDTLAYEQSITVGNKKYTMVYVPGGGADDYYGCVGIRIENIG